MNLSPHSVLDVGCGIGRWGFLCREFLDGGSGRVFAEDWQVRIDAVEIFEPYIGPNHRAVYSNIIIGDIRDIAPQMDMYDLIIAGDVIEHIHKQEALDMIQKLLDHSNIALAVLLRQTGQADDADMFLNALLNRKDIPKNIRQTAESMILENESHGNPDSS